MRAHADPDPRRENYASDRNYLDRQTRTALETREITLFGGEFDLLALPFREAAITRLRKSKSSRDGNGGNGVFSSR